MGYSIIIQHIHTMCNDHDNKYFLLKYYHLYVLYAFFSGYFEMYI